MTLKEKIDHLKQLKDKVTLPFSMSANIPFYVDMRKPRPSLSKHDLKNPTYWHYDDAVYLLACAHLVPELLEELEKLIK